LTAGQHPLVAGMVPSPPRTDPPVLGGVAFEQIDLLASMNFADRRRIGRRGPLDETAAPPDPALVS
jgi:hypothetical protein